MRSTVIIIGAAGLLCCAIFLNRSQMVALRSMGPMEPGGLWKTWVGPKPPMLQNDTWVNIIEAARESMRRYHASRMQSPPSPGLPSGATPRLWHDYLKGIYYANLAERTDRKEEFLTTMSSYGAPMDKMARLDAPKTPRGIVGCAISHYVICDELLQSLDENEKLKWPSARVFERYAFIGEDDFEFRLDNVTVQQRLFQFMAADQHWASTNFSFDVVQLSTSPYDLRLRQQGRRRVRSRPGTGMAAGFDCFPCTKKVQELFLGSNIPDCCGKTWEELLGLVRADAAYLASGYIVRLDRAILTKLRDSFYYSAVTMNRDYSSRSLRANANDAIWRRVMRDPEVNWFIAKPMLGIQRPSWSDIERKKVAYPVPVELER